MIKKYNRKFNLIKKVLDEEKYYLEKKVKVSGWVRTCRTSDKSFGFCILNDGSNVKGIQLIISNKQLEQNLVEYFFKNVKTGSSISVSGKVVESPAKGQTIEIIVEKYNIHGDIDDKYPISKTKINFGELSDASLFLSDNLFLIILKSLISLSISNLTEFFFRSFPTFKYLNEFS